VADRVVVGVVLALEVRLAQRGPVVDVDLAVGRQIFVPGRYQGRLMAASARARSPEWGTSPQWGTLFLMDSISLFSLLISCLSISAS
jgi:hypothetical protein